MANTLSGLAPTLYNALDVISRELVGMIPAVSSDMSFARAAVGQTVTSPVAPASAATDITPAVTAPNDGDQTIGSISMTISKARCVPVRWNGEEKLSLDNNGASYNVILANQFSQAMRTLTNEIEADLALLHTKASRAFGTAATTPFGTNLGESAQVLKILKDNGAPAGDMQLVIDTSAGATMRTLLQLTKANEAADTGLLRRGVLMDVHGFAIRESAQILTPTAGTGAGYLVNAGAGFAIGATAITVDTGANTIIAGDVLTFAGDTNKYVVAIALAANVVTLAAPGLRKAVADNAALTVVAAAARNMAFHRSAIVLATRAPALPAQGDSAVDRMMITDPESGLTFEIAQYAQYRQMQYEVSCAWGTAVTKAAHIALLLG